MTKPKAQKMISTKMGIPNALLSGNKDQGGHQTLEIFVKEEDEALFKAWIKAMTSDVQE
jgi:hypothetical protein